MTTHSQLGLKALYLEILQKNEEREKLLTLLRERQIKGNMIPKEAKIVKDFAPLTI